MAIAACRDPDPGSPREAMQVIGDALSACATLLYREDAIPDAIDLLYRSVVRAATRDTRPSLIRTCSPTTVLPIHRSGVG